MLSDQELLIQLMKDFELAGIEKNDNILIHSSISRLLFNLIKKGGMCSAHYLLNAILQSLIKLVGNKGTLLFPTYNFDFTKGLPFDLLNSESQTGILSEFVRKKYPSNRTKHPIYSFVALGYLEKEFINLKNTDSFSSDSPFNLIHHLNVKICNIDIADEKCMTFFHYVEQQLAVDYRYIKNFKGHYIDSNGIISQRTYSMNVRNTQKNITTDVLGMSSILWKFGINKGHKPGIASGIKIALAKEIFQITKDIIESNKAYGNLYTIELKD